MLVQPGSPSQSPTRVDASDPPLYNREYGGKEGELDLSTYLYLKNIYLKGTYYYLICKSMSNIKSLMVKMFQDRSSILETLIREYKSIDPARNNPCTSLSDREKRGRFWACVPALTPRILYTI